jgi:hypothetical protein
MIDAIGQGVARLPEVERAPIPAQPTALAAVKAAKGEVLEDGSGVRVGGWLITTHKGPITRASLPACPPGVPCLFSSGRKHVALLLYWSSLALSCLQLMLR